MARTKTPLLKRTTDTNLSLTCGKRTATIHGSELEVSSLVRTALQFLTMQIDATQTDYDGAKFDSDMHKEQPDATFRTRLIHEQRVVIQANKLQRLKAQRSRYWQLLGISTETTIL